MVDNPEQVLTLLQIASLSKDWPNLRPIHDRAMEALVKIAQSPAHQEQKPAIKRSLTNG